MVAIRQITRAPDAFRFPIWMSDINYPANSVVAVFDSELNLYEHFIARRSVSGARVPSAEDSDWSALYFDSDIAMNYITKVFNANYEALKAYLQPSVDSDAKVFLDSEFAILAKNVDSDTLVLVQQYSDYDSDQRSLFEQILYSYVDTRVGEFISEYDSDFAIFESKVSGWDSDHIRYDSRINNFFASLDSDVFELRRDYNALAGTQVTDQINISGNTSRILALETNTSNLTTLQSTVDAIPGTYQTLINATNNYNSLTTNYTTADNAVRTDFNVADNSVRSAFAAADNTVRAEFASADNTVRTEFANADAGIIADHDSDQAVITSQLNNVLSQYIQIYNVVNGLTAAALGGGADSDWVIQQITSGITVSGADSDWVIQQMASNVSTGGVDSDWVLSQIGAGSYDSDFVASTNSKIIILDNAINAELVDRQNADNVLTAAIKSKPDSDWILSQISASSTTGEVFTLQGDIAAGQNGQNISVYDWGLNGTTFLNGATVVHMNMALIQVGTTNTRITHDEIIHFAGGTDDGSYFKVGTTTSQGTSPGTLTPVFPVSGTNWYSRVSLTTNNACKWYIWGTKF